MNDYFKMLKNFVKANDESESNNSNILDLTKELATKAGYHRYIHKFKNGNLRERTGYTDKFDDLLTAKWLCYYRYLFVSKLCIHNELKEFYINIINDTFNMVMHSIILEKLTNETVLHKYVNCTLSSRIADVFEVIGSNKLLDEKNSKNKDKSTKRTKIKMKTAINHMAIPIDDESISNSLVYSEFNMSDILMELKYKFKDKPLSTEFLMGIINSSGKINTSNISEYISCEHTSENLKELKEAYHIIKSTLYNYTGGANIPYNKWMIKNKLSFGMKGNNINANNI